MSRRFLVSLLLVDIPFVIVVAVVGWRHPIATVEAFYDWRSDNQWTLLLSIPAAFLIARRWRSR